MSDYRAFPDPAPVSEPESAPVETKVKASGAASLLAGIVVAWLVTKVPALAEMSDVLKVLIAGVLVAAPTVIAGWVAPHTPRFPGTSRK